MFRSVLLASAAAFAAFPAFAQTAPEEVAVELNEISVTANLTPTPTKEVGSAVTVITREELERKQIRLVSDALRSVPGVSVSRSGGFGGQSQVRIRGSEGNHTLVLIDGMEVNNPATESEFYFNNLLALDVERIEVLRGPQSALYGSDAIGGVVNIVTRRGEGKPKITAFSEAGSRGTVSAGASVSGSAERADFLFGVGGFRTDGFSAASEWNGNTEKDSNRNLTGLAKLGFQVTDNLRLDFVGRATDFETQGDLDAANVGATDGGNDVEGRESFARIQASLDMLDGQWQHKLGIGRNHNKYDNDNELFGLSSFEGERTKIDYRTSYFLATGPADHTFTLLADHERDEAEVSYSPLPPPSLEQTGMAGQYEVDVWDKLFLTAGLRHDFNEDFEDATTWRLTGAYIFDGTQTKLRASVGTGVKNPTLFELYGTFPGFIGNPDLKPESAEGWDVGIDQPFLDGRILLGATYFEQRITDLIQLDSVNNTVENLPGVSRIDGVELSAALQPIDGLTVRVSYTWMDAQDANGDRLVRRPEHAASLDADYVFFDGRASVGASIDYNGNRRDVGFDAGFASFPVTLDEFVLVDIRGSYRLNEQTEIYARIENLLDEEYEEVFGFGGTGRLAIAGVKVSF